ncbi:hypothetical protein JYU34_011445, partial [Plutella xylostella]
TGWRDVGVAGVAGGVRAGAGRRAQLLLHQRHQLGLRGHAAHEGARAQRVRLRGPVQEHTLLRERLSEHRMVQRQRGVPMVGGRVQPDPVPRGGQPDAVHAAGRALRLRQLHVPHQQRDAQPAAHHLPGGAGERAGQAAHDVRVQGPVGAGRRRRQALLRGFSRSLIPRGCSQRPTLDQAVGQQLRGRPAAQPARDQDHT